MPVGYDFLTLALTFGPVRNLRGPAWGTLPAPGKALEHVCTDIICDFDRPQVFVSRSFYPGLGVVLLTCVYWDKLGSSDLSLGLVGRGMRLE